MTYEVLIQPALWAVSIGVATVYAARASRAARSRRIADRTRSRPLFIRAGIAALVAALVVPAIGIVPPGHRGVIYSAGGGISANERGEGFTLMIPWIQHMRSISVRTHKVFSDQVFAQSLDLQEITVVASVNYHIEPDRAAELYQEVGSSYQVTVIQPALFQRTKAAVGQVAAEDFASNRAALAATIQAQLAEQLAPYGIVIEFINIEDAIFDPAFVESVKQKVIAEQEATKQENLIRAEAAKKEQVIIQAEARARSVLVEAEAQADANELLALSLTPELLRWRWLVGWDGVLPTTLVGGKAPLLIDGRQVP
jgi:regulator of protease activity HflC (stomatin/prohibitin superfamily)